jgi:hypothetical protein
MPLGKFEGKIGGHDELEKHMLNWLDYSEKETPQ